MFETGAFQEGSVTTLRVVAITKGVCTSHAVQETYHVNASFGTRTQCSNVIKRHPAENRVMLAFQSNWPDLIAFPEDVVKLFLTGLESMSTAHRIGSHCLIQIVLPR